MDILIVFAIIAFLLFLRGIYISQNNKTIDSIEKTDLSYTDIHSSDTTIKQKKETYHHSKPHTTEEKKKFKTAKVKRIIDGDTAIVIKNNTECKIRLASIDCPEDGQHWGDTATYGLIKLIGGKTIQIEEHGIDHYGRVIATIYTKKGTEWINVNERMVALGHAWVMRKYYNHLPPHKKNTLNRLEQWARSKKVGLWKAPNPIPPWKWRCETAKT